MTAPGPRRWLSIAVIALLVLQVVIAGARAALTVRSQDAFPSAPAIDAAAFPTPDMALTIESGAQRGDEVAGQWASGAVLVFASMQVDWPTDPPPATVTTIPPFGWIRLMYVAPVDDGPSDYAALSLMFERVSGRLADARVTRWDVEPNQANLLDGIKVDDQTALLGAEIDSGTVYRSSCPDKRNESMVSLGRDTTTGEPVWNISYDENGRNSSGTLLIDVNGATGAVTDVRPGPAACAKNG